MKNIANKKSKKNKIVSLVYTSEANGRLNTPIWGEREGRHSTSMAKGQGSPACHSRGTKLPFWRTRHVDKRIEKELKAIKLRDGPLEKLWGGRGIFEPQEFFLYFANPTPPHHNVSNGPSLRKKGWS